MNARQKINVLDLRHLIHRGLSTAQIAARFGVQSPAVTRACRNNGIALPTGRGTKAEPSRADDERELDCIRRVVAGDAIQRVADRYGMSNKTVQKIIKAVETADMAESGEPVLVVAKAYMRRRTEGRR